MIRPGTNLTVAFATLCALVAAAGCGDDAGSTRGDPQGDRPTIVVTTTVLGDVVTNLVGDLATVETVLPTGADPHDFQASAAQADAMSEADVLVTNGAGFEEGLLDQVESVEADGTPVCAAIDGVATIGGAEDSHGEEHTHDEDGAHDADEEREEDTDGHDHGENHDGVDPHFFTDPARTAAASEHLLECIAASTDALDPEELQAEGTSYIEELRALDDEVEAVLAVIPAEDRVLVTNHEVFAYFAERYGFEVPGTVIPSTSTQAQADAAALAALADTVREEGVPAVFTETSSADDLARTLADEAGGVEVVALFGESLGPDGGETYVEMVRTNAERITEALG